jgi:hypothetical protein
MTALVTALSLVALVHTLCTTNTLAEGPLRTVGVESFDSHFISMIFGSTLCHCNYININRPHKFLESNLLGNTPARYHQQAFHPSYVTISCDATFGKNKLAPT